MNNCREGNNMEKQKKYLQGIEKLKETEKRTFHGIFAMLSIFFAVLIAVCLTIVYTKEIKMQFFFKC